MPDRPSPLARALGSFALWLDEVGQLYPGTTLDAVPPLTADEADALGHAYLDELVHNVRHAAEARRRLNAICGNYGDLGPGVRGFLICQLDPAHSSPQHRQGDWEWLTGETPERILEEVPDA